MVLEKKEIILKGIAAAPGIALGCAYHFVKDIPHVVEVSLEQDGIELEIDRLLRAIARAEKELTKILEFAKQKIGDRKAKIFEAQIMVLQDTILIDILKSRIRNEKKNAEFIVHDEISKYSNMMRAARDEYMHERAHDIEDLKYRIIRNLQQEKLISKLEGSPIVVAHSLTPADAVILSRNNILGYAMDLGGVTSHAVLLSRALKIPAVVGLRDISRCVTTGDFLVLDGYSGVVIVNPTQERIQEYELKRKQMLEFETRLVNLRDLPPVTIDGRRIELSANIELLEEIDFVLAQGSQGVGLYRSESMLINREDFPTEEEQYMEYREIADRLFPQRVIMRTFDIGGDKLISDVGEANPFMGWRGIRLMLDRVDLFMDQLRAMLRASVRNNVCIMFPMVSNISEVRKAKELVEKAKNELRSKNIKFDEKIQIGVMIEIPSAALAAKQIACEVDFMSIGTNDLIQYMLAVDRSNNLVSNLYREFDPSVLRTLKFIIDAGHSQGKWVGMCGEMAGNPLAVPLLVGLGIDELSVIPSVLPEIKKVIRALHYSEVKKLASQVLRCSSSETAEQMLREFIHKEIPDIPLLNEQEIV